jgi:CBS-domain-containing membrane protein
MSAGRVHSRHVAPVPPDATVEEAARVMARIGVDTLLVVDGEERPLGTLTDRDLVVRCVARGRPPGETFVADVMTAPVPEELLGSHGYETLSCLLALDDALDMVRRAMDDGQVLPIDNGRPEPRARDRRTRPRPRPESERKRQRNWE